MGFFDLNIPYYESDRNVSNKTALKTARLKLTIKSMELGYSGIAYNRTIRGVMSESNRCCIPLFPLSSVLKLAPSLSSAVEFHRNLLNVPVKSPFRQYTRLTVLVESAAQASALNSGNPILKSYDMVAVRPLNQSAFEQACQASEVDIIAIDFSEKLPFRLKQSMVKAAIQRGVYFEITYSSLILDVQMRRQMISNAKLLVDWTRGKNLIFSSAAPSVTELRGPYDVSNLAFLLGLRLECAKAALSKNCRTVITNALRKRSYHKEAIKVDLVTSGAKEPEFDNWLKWDPISSGEGDLLLDDLKKSFSAPSNVSKNMKRVEFNSVLNNLPSSEFQIKDLLTSAVPSKEPVHTIANNLEKEKDRIDCEDMICTESLYIKDTSGTKMPNLQSIGTYSTSSDVDTITHDLEKEKENDMIDNEDMECTESLDINDTSGTKIHDLQSTGTYSASSDGFAALTDSATIQSCSSDIEAIAPLNYSDNLENEKGNGRSDDEDMKGTESLDAKDTRETKMHFLQSTGTCSARCEGYVELRETAIIHPCRSGREVKENIAIDSDEMRSTNNFDIQDVAGTNMHVLPSAMKCSDNCEGYAVLLDNAIILPCRKAIELKENNTVYNDEMKMSNNLGRQDDASGTKVHNLQNTGICSASNPMEVENEHLVFENLPVEHVSEGEPTHAGNNIERSYQILGGSLSGNLKRRRSYRPSLFPFKRILSRGPSKSKAQRLNQFDTFMRFF